MTTTSDRMNNRNSNNIIRCQRVNFEFPFIFALRLVEKQSNTKTGITDKRKLRTGAFEKRF